MEIVLDKQNSIIKPTGRLDANSSSDFQKAIDEITEIRQDLIIDMSACPYLSSAGIRVILIARKKLNANNRELYISGLEPNVMQVLQMAGLHQMLHLEPSLNHALSKRKMSESLSSSTQVTTASLRLDFQFLHQANTKAYCWVKPTILSFNELNFGIGLGTMNKNDGTEDVDINLFVASQHCVGFLPLNPAQESDFRITTEPAKTGLYVSEAISFGKLPYGAISCTGDEFFRMSQLMNDINDLLNQTGDTDTVKMFVMLNRDREAPSISFLIYNDSIIKDKLTAVGLHHMMEHITNNDSNDHFFGISFLLAELEFDGNLQELPGFIDRHLGFENIVGVRAFDEHANIYQPLMWIFRATELVDGKQQLLSIDTPNSLEFESEKAFLARQLYTDSSRLVIDQLHGGFSAQTFSVNSFDHESRKLRPTVLKIAPRDLIERESAGCQQYALPYIFNNSAVVLGATYFGDLGALRYNFVGIGGEESRLQWLTKYYEQLEPDDLEPLFDKIFLQILKPWYGQTVDKDLKLFSEHDPTFTFFPHIFDVALNVWGIDADEQHMMIEGKQYLNPYWYLKYKYAKYRDFKHNYPTAVCHGDLNMQNILLDESMNIYLIDFSETRPRAAIADFARLEAIMMVDRAVVDSKEAWLAYADFLSEFYQSEVLDFPKANWEKNTEKSIRKQLFVTQKMRTYAKQAVADHTEVFPYYLALLEWVLPIICYTLPLPQRKISTVASSILCQKLMESGFD